MLRPSMNRPFARFIIVSILSLSDTLQASSSLAFKDKEAETPIQIQSNTANFDNNTGLATHQGQVVLTQGTRRLTGDTLVIHRKDGKIDKVIAQGNPVRFEVTPDPTKPKITGKANIVHYRPEKHTITLIENAELCQNNNTIQSATLTYGFDTGLLSSESSHGKRTTVILKHKQANP